MRMQRELDNPWIYEIRVKGLIDSRWSDWFFGFTIQEEAEGQTTLYGSVPDQAALHGLLAKIRDLGLPLLALALHEDNIETEADAPPPRE